MNGNDRLGQPVAVGTAFTVQPQAAPARIRACAANALGSCLGFCRRIARRARDAQCVEKVAIAERAHVVDPSSSLYAVVVEEIRNWSITTKALPQSGLGKAIAYMVRLWRYLIRFVDDPQIPLDNNRLERSMRGPVMGRKNHNGSHSKRGTQVAAIFYSLIESAKPVGIEPKANLREATIAALTGQSVLLPHEVAEQVAESVS